MESAVEVNAGFLMDGDPVDASFGEGGDKSVRPFDHEVAIEGDLGGLAKRRDYRWADRKIGDEVAIHDVDVEDGGSAIDRRLRLFA